MKSKEYFLTGHKIPAAKKFLLPAALLFLLMMSSALKVNGYDYRITGHVSSKLVVEETSPDSLETTITVKVAPLPVALLEVYHAGTSEFLGSGASGMKGYFHVDFSYGDAPSFPVYVVAVRVIDGERKVYGRVDKDRDNAGLVMNAYTRAMILHVQMNGVDESEDIRFCGDGKFKFVQVGDLPVHFIKDQEVDGISLQAAGITEDGNPLNHIESAFGGTLNLHGLFGGGDGVYYYKIHYDGVDSSGTAVSGYISDPLYKYNYRAGGEVEYVELGPVDRGSIGLEDVYIVNERMPYPCSPFWAETSIRAKWNTTGITGFFRLELEAFDINGDKVELDDGTGTIADYGSLNLRLVNNPPTCAIHEIQHLNGLRASDDDCDIIYLDSGDAGTCNLQFNITANQVDGFVGTYKIDIFKAHNAYVDTIGKSTPYPIPTYGPVGVSVPPTAPCSDPVYPAYENCAYRFRLHIWPRITNGRDPHIYERQDNWYVYIMNK